MSPDAAAGTINGLVSQVRKDGRPVVRIRCTDYGAQWVVECEVYPVDQLTVQARRFIDESLLALQIFGCDVV